MRDLEGEWDSAQFGWPAHKLALVGWPPWLNDWLVGWLAGVSLIQIHLWSWPVRGYDNPHHGHQSTTAYGYQALPIVVFFAYWEGSPRGLDDDDSPQERSSE